MIQERNRDEMLGLCSFSHIIFEHQCQEGTQISHLRAPTFNHSLL